MGFSSTYRTEGAKEALPIFKKAAPPGVPPLAMVLPLCLEK